MPILDSAGAFRVDEIRIGSTFASVTPASEPTTLALLVAGALGLAAHRR